MSAAERIGTRADQGLPEKIEDEAILDAAAVLLAAVLAEWAGEGGDRGAA
jgi:hypothetical protein